MNLLARLGLAGPARGQWWANPLVLAGVMLLSTVPLWFTSVPPLIDLPGHTGRYYVELNLAHSPVLQRNWAFHWRLTGNLGVDLLIVPLSAIFGLERAVWLVALTLPPLMIWGIARMSRALHGEFTPFALAAIPFALAYPYQFGFVNYWLGCALAFHAFASWVEADASGRSGRLRAALFTPAAVAIWLAHAYGWAILVVLVAAFELSRAFTRELSRWPAMGLRVIGRVWPVAVPIVLMIAWRGGAGSATTGDFFNFGAKFAGLLCTLRDQNQWLDRASLLFALVLIYVGVRKDATRVNPALGLAAALFAALVLLMPGQLFGSGFADIRLWPICFIAALAAIAPAQRTWRGAPVIAGLALALFVARIAVMSAGFAAYDRDYTRHLRALDYVPRGASIAMLTRGSTCEGWRYERLAHLDSLAIVRKEAFVNSQWETPGAQLLVSLGARGSAFNADPSQYVDAAPVCDGAIGATLASKIRQIPRERFDYVWLLGFDTRHLDVGPDLSRVYSDDRTALYKLKPGHDVAKGMTKSPA
jgi:hypothetical protein